MRLKVWLELAQQYAELGEAMTEQLRDVAAGKPLDEQNPDALMECMPLLEQINKLAFDTDCDLSDDCANLMAEIDKIAAVDLDEV